MGTVELGLILLHFCASFAGAPARRTLGWAKSSAADIHSRLAGDELIGPNRPRRGSQAGSFCGPLQTVQKYWNIAIISGQPPIRETQAAAM